MLRRLWVKSQLKLEGHGEPEGFRMGPYECFHWQEYAVCLLCTTFNPAEVHLKGKVDPAQTWLQMFGTGLESASGVSLGLRPKVWLSAMIFSLKILGSDLDQPFQQFVNLQPLMSHIRPPALTLSLA